MVYFIIGPTVMALLAERWNAYVCSVVAINVSILIRHDVNKGFLTFYGPGEVP